MTHKTNGCGELRLSDVGKRVVIQGWVQRNRDHGGILFIDMRDRSGLVQTVINPQDSSDTFKTASEARGEWVLEVEGVVSKRPEGTANPNLPTGEVEILVDRIDVLNPSKTPPFIISDQVDVDESIRLKYRYLDLRRPTMRKNLELRHRVIKTMRDFFDAEGFWEVETPMLWKSTPEGAREYVVPARLNPGQFFVLPQSPQLCKQLLMVAGVEKYFQIARCFRDEDLRADRQPEFTQVDVEMSFVDTDDIIGIMEKLLAHTFKKTMGIELKTPFIRIPYQEAMDRFGSDKPDTRFGLELVDLSEELKGSEAKVFASALSSGGKIKALNAKGCAHFSRKEIENLTEIAKGFGAKGLATIAFQEEGIKSALAKFLKEEEIEKIKTCCKAETGDLILIVAAPWQVAVESLGRVRLELGKQLNLIDPDKLNFLWVVDFPLFAWNETENRVEAMHHPFSYPKDEDIQYLESDPLRVHGKLYDIVLNGFEVGGGSIRIHREDLQDKIFKAIGMTKEEAYKRFGFLLEAFQYGAPPHGGIALGLDRLLALMAKTDSIRDVIAFPKTASCTDPLSDAPSAIPDAQMNELHIQVALDDEEKE